MNYWMAESNFTIGQLALLLAYWCSEKSIAEAAEFAGTNRMTVMEKYREFRESAEDVYRKDIAEHPLGRQPGDVCQVDQSLFGNAKYHVGRHLRTQQWAIGAFVSNSRRVAVELTPDK